MHTSLDGVHECAHPALGESTRRRAPNREASPVNSMTFG